MPVYPLYQGRCKKIFLRPECVNCVEIPKKIKLTKANLLLKLPRFASHLAVDGIRHLERFFCLNRSVDRGECAQLVKLMQN